MYVLMVSGGMRMASNAYDPNGSPSLYTMAFPGRNSTSKEDAFISPYFELVPDPVPSKVLNDQSFDWFLGLKEPGDPNSTCPILDEDELPLPGLENPCGVAQACLMCASGAIGCCGVARTCPASESGKS